jgi:hypothetical protein
MLSKIDRLVTDNPLTRTIRQRVSDPMDNYFRTAHYLDVLSKTRSPKMAAESVRKYLFNYSELTTADRLIKGSILPFWNWTKNNIPLQLHNVFTQPRFAATYLKIKEQSMGDLSNDPDVPEYIKNDYIRFGENSFYNPRPPVQDLGMLTNPNRLLGMQNPMLRIPQEFLLNRSYFSEKPIQYGADNFKEYDYNLFTTNKDGEKEISPLAEYMMGQTALTSRGLSFFRDINNEKDDKMWYDNVRDLFIGKTQPLKKENKNSKRKLSPELLK